MIGNIFISSVVSLTGNMNENINTVTFQCIKLYDIWCTPFTTDSKWFMLSFEEYKQALFIAILRTLFQ